MLHDPEVLILDEPTTGLDPNQLVEIRELIKNIGKDKTVFLSTHIMQEVEAICERVIIINKGKIVEDKNLKHLVKEQLCQTISIEFDQMLQEEDFTIFTNLIKLTTVAPTSFELTFESDTDMRPLLFDFAKEKGLKILQLSLKNKNLEQIFREKTTNN